MVNQALDSIMGMAVQLPALKKLGDELGISMENGLAGVVNDALSPSSGKAPDETAAAPEAKPAPAPQKPAPKAPVKKPPEA